MQNINNHIPHPYWATSMFIHTSITITFTSLYTRTIIKNRDVRNFPMITRQFRHLSHIQESFQQHPFIQHKWKVGNSQNKSPLKFTIITPDYNIISILYDTISIHIREETEKQIKKSITLTRANKKTTLSLHKLLINHSNYLKITRNRDLSFI